MIGDLRTGVDYCGYCKSGYDENGACQCDGHGNPKGSYGKCGYCHDYLMEQADGSYKCSCDGFGGDPVTHEKSCRYCSGLAIGNFCTICNMAQ